MSTADRIKWNQRYAEHRERKNNPVTLLETWLSDIRPGRALDVACGAGRNAFLLASSGFRVDAIDISVAGLQRARQQARQRRLEINWIEHDLDRDYEFETDYDLIVVFWYVNLPLITRLCENLAPGGYLLCEEHLLTDEAVIGPTCSDFRVSPGALRLAASALDVIHYQESIENAGDGERVASARLVARRFKDSLINS